MNDKSPFASGNWPPTTADLYMSGQAARVIDYADFDEGASLECPVCHWVGAVREGSREYYRDLFDVSCPRCDKMLLIVGY